MPSMSAVQERSFSKNPAGKQAKSKYPSLAFFKINQARLDFYPRSTIMRIKYARV